MVEAVGLEEKRLDDVQWYRTAWMAANIMNASGNMRSATDPKKLLGEDFFNSLGEKPEPERFTPEEREAYLNDLESIIEEGKNKEG